jgi:Lar family restriction alleviation protein
MSQNEDELKPCPFCGGEATIDKLNDSDYLEEYNQRWDKDEYHARCSGCNALIGPFDDEKQAVLEWNTRHESAELATAEAMASAIRLFYDTKHLVDCGPSFEAMGKALTQWERLPPPAPEVSGEKNDE